MTTSANGAFGRATILKCGFGFETLDLDLIIFKRHRLGFELFLGGCIWIWRLERIWISTFLDLPTTDFDTLSVFYVVEIFVTTTCLFIYSTIISFLCVTVFPRPCFGVVFGFAIFSPTGLMHGGLLYIPFSLSFFICRSVTEFTWKEKLIDKNHN